MKINSTMKSRIQQAAILSVALATVILGVRYETQSSVTTAEVEVSSHGTAGIISTMSEIQYDASKGAAGSDASNLTILGGNPYGMSGTATAMDTQDANTNTTGAAEESDAEWANKLMTTVDDYMNVRESASSDAAVVGKLRKGDLAEIIGTEGDWTQITSGNLTGFVSNEFVVTGDAAKAQAYDICLLYATSTTGGLRVRETASEDGSVVTALSEGERLEVAGDAEAVEGWTAVTTSSGATAYVKSDYVTVALSTGTGITVEEEQQALAAKKAEEEKKAAAQQAANTVATVQNAPVAASYDDVTVLAALIQAEAGYEPYEGQLAVGAVVVNRFNRGYASSISGVIYAPGQFSPAGSGRVDQILAQGPKASCIQAAQEALSGVDNTGGATSFRPVRSGRPGLVIANQVFW
ncbi:MAG: SH3 domain-containing protein [Lachnospiraceae bacterium]|nr:SH3 domain-containing protein [Lachnospiraceae bacterium]